MDLYLIPGLGTDHRLFARCDFGDHRVVPLEWPVMVEGSTLADYARALSEKIDASRPHALIGTSMGGMVAQEMAAITRPARTIIISSWKGPQEMPWLIRSFRGMRPERMVNDWIMHKCVPVIRMLRWKLGMENKEAQQLVMSMMDRWPAAQIRVMTAAVMKWEGAQVPSLVHIHGDRDALMPVARIRNAVVIKGGTHLMIYTKADEVSATVQRALSSSP